MVLRDTLRINRAFTPLHVVLVISLQYLYIEVHNENS
jgi:hypothetical protein